MPGGKHDCVRLVRLIDDACSPYNILNKPLTPIQSHEIPLMPVRTGPRDAGRGAKLGRGPKLRRPPAPGPCGSAIDRFGCTRAPDPSEGETTEQTR